MLAFRSLDPFRALREPDRRRRDEERLSRSEQRTLSKTQNNHLTGKAPYRFESCFLQQRVRCEPHPRRRSAGKGRVPRAPPEHLSADEVEFLRWRAERWMKLRHMPAVSPTA